MFVSATNCRRAFDIIGAARDLVSQQSRANLHEARKHHIFLYAILESVNIFYEKDSIFLEGFI